MNRGLEFFPFEITRVLTDNGPEFTNRLIKSKKGELCQKPPKPDEVCKANHIEHRLTWAQYTKNEWHGGKSRRNN